MNEQSPPAITNQVYQWPEFQAFTKRLGKAIRLDRSLVIDLMLDCEVVITQEYTAQDKGPSRE